jgi:uroporphyrin-3 C-methyltransferase
MFSLRAMADHPPDTASTDRRAEPSRRVHSYGRLTTALAVLALATAGYALWRLDAARDHIAEIDRSLTQLESGRTLLDAELKTQQERNRAARAVLARRLDAFADTPQQLREFATALEELRGRAEGPERAWSRAEAAFLMELAQQRLALDRDVATAVVALQAADSRLASLRDPGVGAVRQQLGKEIQALRVAPRPDTAGILARLTNAEEQAGAAAVAGIVAIERPSAVAPLPDGFFARAWTMARNALAGLITVRKVDSRDSVVVTIEEEALRRQHLQLLLYSARAAVVRHDAAAYRSSLAGARQWLAEFFDRNDPATAALIAEVAVLEPIDIDPPLPDISASARALERLSPGKRTAP